jgi:hypothetical protein
MRTIGSASPIAATSVSFSSFLPFWQGTAEVVQRATELRIGLNHEN